MREENGGLRLIHALVASLVLLICAACAAAAPNDEASLMPRERVALVRLPTLTPRLIDAMTQPASPAPATIAPFSASSTLPSPAQFSAVAQNSPSPSLVPSVTMTPDAAIIGYSGEGRPITAYHFGTGDRVLLLVGGIHGGWEANTVRLAGELIDHFAHNPQDVLPGISIVIIPVANPDGLTRRRVWAGRLNANGVDLNRNWSCGWSAIAYWQQARVNPGMSAMSEPETRVLSDYVLRIQPSAALFYHSAADGVFAGVCDGDHGSAAMSAIYGQATGYRYGSPFSAYPVTGTASDWLDGQGVPSADVELITSYDSEFARNLRGVLALMQWLLDSPR